ncbi:hypothetical protein CHARACLAT_028146 [Characodon lateralis]|uniref:Secreted protein n=1 Tax=Characodon lateralis TaxID=208331 RepID=A0ABU7DUV1_9TELE|nr:hypothetical protein [Characodon lateralis]
MWQRYKVVVVFSSASFGSSGEVCCISLLSSAALQSSNCCTVLISSLVKASPSSLSSTDACSFVLLDHSSSLCSSLTSEIPGSSKLNCCVGAISSVEAGTAGGLASEMTKDN